MAPLPLALSCLLALYLAALADPVGATPRLADLGALALAFSFGRTLLGGGIERMVVLAAALAGGASWLSVGSGTQALAAFLAGGMVGVFLAILDLFTLRRSDARRLYNFLLVLVVVRTSWYTLAVWLPGLQFPRPHLLPSLVAEALGGVALALTCVLAAPGLDLPAPVTRRATKRPPPAPGEGLVMEPGLGEIAHDGGHRDTIAPPPTPGSSQEPGNPEP